jgi:hypothetical protein
MAAIWPVVWEHMAKAQEPQVRAYNRMAQLEQFRPGDKLLFLIPTLEHRLLAQWQGPYMVTEQVAPVNHRVCQSG